MFFGVHIQDLSLPFLKLVSYIYLSTLIFYLPTMVLNKGSEEDSENEEQAMISKIPIDVISFIRRIICVGGKNIPATIQLLGCQGKRYLGIKVTMFDPDTISESGFFMTLD